MEMTPDERACFSALRFEDDITTTDQQYEFTYGLIASRTGLSIEQVAAALLGLGGRGTLRVNVQGTPVNVKFIFPIGTPTGKDLIRLRTQPAYWRT